MRHWLALVAAVGVMSGSVPLASSETPASIVPAKQQWPLDAAHFDATKLWQVSRGAGVTVAVVDSGVDPIKSLAGRLEPGVDELAGRRDGRADASPESHGTSVAAVIAAAGSRDGTALAGIAPQARVLPVAIGDDSTGSSATIAQGIAYAATHGARVINVSLDLDVAEPSLRAAIRLAADRDAVVVASSGNDGTDVSRYPASLPGVVSVGGVDRDGQRWRNGNNGPDVALLAPSVGIYTVSRAGYELADGTTYSAAYVSGIAALLRSRFPNETAGQVIRRLTGSATEVEGETGTGYGEVAPAAALAIAAPGVRTNPLLHRSSASPVRSPRTSLSWLWWVVPLVTVLGLATAGLLVRRRST